MGGAGINKFFAGGRTTTIPQKGKLCYYIWNLLYAFTEICMISLLLMVEGFVMQSLQEIS